MEKERIEGRTTETNDDHKIERLAVTTDKHGNSGRGDKNRIRHIQLQSQLGNHHYSDTSFIRIAYIHYETSYGRCVPHAHTHRI